MILCIETATPVCSVALCTREGVVSQRHNSESRSHASLLTVFIEELFREQKIGASALEAVAVSKGPGSYTGLRIGVSVAKGIAYRAGKPLIAVDTLYSMFLGMRQSLIDSGDLTDDTLFCPMLDARRMEVYYCLFDSRGNKESEIKSAVIENGSFNEIPPSRPVIFFGDGALKCKDVINRGNSRFDDNHWISASFMQKAAYDAFNEKRFEDLAYFEPFYLKDFITTTRKKNILG